MPSIDFRQLDIAAHSVLPFYRAVFVGFNEDEEFFISGGDATLSDMSKVLNVLDIHGAPVTKNLYKASRLIEKRRNGETDVTKVVTVTGVQRAHLKKVLKRPSLFVPPTSLDCLESKITEHLTRYVNAGVLKREANAYIEHLTLKENENIKGKKTITDEDGFIYPTGLPTEETRKGPNVVPISGSGHNDNVFLSSTNMVRVQDTKKKRKGGQEDDFYRFQIRQQKEQEYKKMKTEKEQDLLTIEKLRSKKTVHENIVENAHCFSACERSTPHITHKRVQSKSIVYVQEVNEDDRLCYRIEVPSNRVDLLSVEGISLALNVYRHVANVPRFLLSRQQPLNEHCIYVKASVVPLRPYCFGAILKGIRFTNENLKSFIDLQDKLHQNIARKRQLVAIGTHDLETIQGPFVYEANPPAEIQFAPLNVASMYDGYGIMELLSSHPQLKTYLALIRDSPVYPVIRDSSDVVLSLPPIINGDHSKITLKTRDVFLEVTAVDACKGSIVLNAIVSAFSLYCATPFTIEPVRVCYDADHSLLGGKSFINPCLKGRVVETSIAYLSRVTGIPNLKAETVCSLLNKMMLQASVVDEEHVRADIPITRSDVLHACDLAEDVAVAFGIESKDFSVACSLPHSSLSNRIRSEIAQCGYHECLTWGLCSIQEAFEKFGYDLNNCSTENDSGMKYQPFGAPVLISNPKTKEFEMVRVSLIPGLLKSLAVNCYQELPLKLFEIGNCVTRGTTGDKGEARTHCYCAALVANHSGSGLELAHGLLDHVLQHLGLQPEYQEFQHTSRHSVTSMLIEPRKIYALEPMKDIDPESTSFLPLRSVNIVVRPDNIRVGRMGVLHPSVLKQFAIPLPCAVFEISLTPFLRWLSPHQLYAM